MANIQSGMDMAAEISSTMAAISIDEHTMIVVIRTRTVDVTTPDSVARHTSPMEDAEYFDWTISVDATIVADGQSEKFSTIERASSDVCNKIGEGNVLHRAMMRIFSDAAKAWVDKYHPAAPLTRKSK